MGMIFHPLSYENSGERHSTGLIYDTGPAYCWSQQCGSKMYDDKWPLSFACKLYQTESKNKFKGQLLVIQNIKFPSVGVEWVGAM